MSGEDKPYWSRAARGLPFAIGALIVLIVTDTMLKSAGGFGVMDLQHAAGEAQARDILAAWRGGGGADGGVLGLVGFSTGFDFLFILLYLYVLWNGSLGARQTYRKLAPGLSWLFTLLVVFAPVAAVLDALENIYSVNVVLRGEDGALASLMTITSVKWIFAYISISYVALSALWAGVLSRFWGPR